MWRQRCCSRYATLWKLSDSGHVIWRRDFAAEATAEDFAAGLVTQAYGCDFDPFGNVYQTGYGNVPIQTNGALAQRPLYTLRKYSEGGSLLWSWSDAPFGNVDGFGVRSGPTPQRNVRCLPDGRVLIDDDFGVATMLSAAGSVLWSAELWGFGGRGAIAGFQLQETLADISLWHTNAGGEYEVINLFSNEDGSYIPTTGMVGGGTGNTLIATFAPGGDVVQALSNGSRVFVLRYAPPYSLPVYCGATSDMHVARSIRTDGSTIVVTGNFAAGYGYRTFDLSTDLGTYEDVIAELPGNPGMILGGTLNEDVRFVADTIGTKMVSESTAYGGHRRDISFGPLTVGANFPLAVSAINDARNQDGETIWCGLRSQGTFIRDA